MDENFCYMDEIEPHEWRQSPMDENWQHDKYDIEEGLDKTNETNSSFSSIFMHMSHFHVWVSFMCDKSFVHVLKVPSIVSLISSKFYECHFHTCVPLFFNVQVSFICHKFIRVENFLSILSQKKIPKCCSFSFMWWTSSICVPFSCPLWVSFTIW